MCLHINILLLLLLFSYSERSRELMKTWKGRLLRGVIGGRGEFYRLLLLLRQVSTRETCGSRAIESYSTEERRSLQSSLLRERGAVSIGIVEFGA
jgi:hypothetical protein